MIVTCPACATRYLVDPRALGETGRSVRCTQCNSIWRQMPAEDAPHRVDLPAPGSASASRRALPAPPPVATPAPAMAAAASTAYPAAREFAYPDSRTETRSRSGTSSLMILLLVIVVLGGLWWGRATIIEYVPALGGVYSALGLV